MRRRPAPWTLAILAALAAGAAPAPADGPGERRDDDAEEREERERDRRRREREREGHDDDRDRDDDRDHGRRRRDEPPPGAPPTAPPAPPREGRLRRFERHASERDRPPPGSPSRQPGTVVGEILDLMLQDTECGNECGTDILAMLAVPWWGPMDMLGDDGSVPRRLSWRPHPASGRGYGDVENGHDVAGTVGASYQRVSDRIEAKRLEARVRTGWRFGGDFAYTEYDEDLGDARDVLRVRAGHLTYDFARHTHWTFTSGLGWKSMEGVETTDGFDFLYRVETYPVRPWIFDLTLEAAPVSGGLLGEISLGGGVVLKNLEARLGYRTLTIDGDDLSGPEAGLVVWF